MKRVARAVFGFLMGAVVAVLVVPISIRVVLFSCTSEGRIAFEAFWPDHDCVPGEALDADLRGQSQRCIPYLDGADRPVGYTLTAEDVHFMKTKDAFVQPGTNIDPVGRELASGIFAGEQIREGRLR